jgi:hypothetical protein
MEQEEIKGKATVFLGGEDEFLKKKLISYNYIY